MTTRKIMIKNKYIEFNDILIKNEFTDEMALFPSLEDLDITDLTYLLTLTFMGITKEEQFKNKVQELAELSDVKLTDDKLNILSTLIYNFMNWMRAL